MLASLAGLAVICTALAFVLFFQLIAEVGPARATVITYVNPAVAVALGVGVLGEPLTPEIIAAFGLILAGSVLATQSGRTAARPATRGPGDARPVPRGPWRRGSRAGGRAGHLVPGGRPAVTVPGPRPPPTFPGP